MQAIYEGKNSIAITTFVAQLQIPFGVNLTSGVRLKVG